MKLRLNCETPSRYAGNPNGRGLPELLQGKLSPIAGKVLNGFLPPTRSRHLQIPTCLHSPRAGSVESQLPTILRIFQGKNLLERMEWSFVEGCCPMRGSRNETVCKEDWGLAAPAPLALNSLIFPCC